MGTEEDVVAALSAQNADIIMLNEVTASVVGRNVVDKISSALGLYNQWC
jgi:hypothetical protein